MLTESAWQIDPFKILTRRELTHVLDDLAIKADRSTSMRLNRVIFRLACCCGLRVSEIGALRLIDVKLDTSRPHLHLLTGVAKGGRARRVPLWWDAGTLDDLKAWRAERLSLDTLSTSPFISSPRVNASADSLGRHTLRKRFLTSCKSLGLERLRSLTIHHGRHTFISHALAGGRTLAEVRAAAGQSSLVTTSLYLHIAVGDDGQVGGLFAF